eukprot:TRINITY_DN496_c0_g1_i1.p1 TRINITY_DN496_c0_g1~~TRINITY_DN496_c0_g1_i1.p1  ORF type:complete len:232 (+),score=47.65 TRINITY_DN496_c0_g1_i1:44-739(+)
MERDGGEKKPIYLIKPQEKNANQTIVVNTTSRSKEEWSKGLSPFYLGPIKLYGNYESLTMENAWQFAKVYKHHVDPQTGEPTKEYFEWAVKGWSDPKPYRAPMGRGAIPEYSYWDGKKYDYINARKKIYCPLYAQLVSQTIAFSKLQSIYNKCKSIYLIDFDAYDYWNEGITLSDCINDPSRCMGHSFVLAGLLQNNKFWEVPVQELNYVGPENKEAYYGSKAEEEEEESK